MRAFTKLDDAPILDRSETSSADYIVILDDTLYTPALLSQLKANGKILINTKHAPEGCTAIDGTAIAEGLRLPVVNTVMLGALSGISGVVSVQEIEAAIAGYMPQRIQEKNRAAVSQAAKEAVR